MQRAAAFVVLLAAVLLLPASEAGAVAAQQAAVTIVHRPTETTDAQAQQLFDEGLTFVYGFNRSSAESRFRAAAARDPKFASAWWGVALALGPNINVESTPADMKKAAEAVARARSLAENAAPVSRALIDALSKRYAPGGRGDAKMLANSYARAMRIVADSYADDPDVAALSMESALDVYWSDAPRTNLLGYEEFVASTPRLIERWPSHIGLAHYFIHIQESRNAQLALPSAMLLHTATFAPEASHLTHMGGHIFLAVGDYARVIDGNRRAHELDLEQAKSLGVAPESIEYFGHNIDFWYGGAVLGGDEAAARAVADAVASENPALGWVSLARFGHTFDALKVLERVHAGQHVTDMGLSELVAYALLNADANRLDETRKARTALVKRDGRKRSIALDMVDARLAEGEDGKRAVTLYERAATALEKFTIENSQVWYFPARERLASFQLASGDAAGAAATASAGLRFTPHAAALEVLLAKAKR